MKWLAVIPLICAMAAVPSEIRVNKSDGDLKAGGLTISKAGQQLILDYEVGGGEVYYNRYLQRPCWPEGFSGVTWGIGFDAAHSTREQIAETWKGLPPKTIARLQDCAGIKGQAAKLKLASVRDIVIPWEFALRVYQQKTIPRFAAKTKAAYPGVETLHPSAQGAYLSWVFNRGEGISSSNRDLEKRQIRHDTPNLMPRVPGHFLASQRIWLGAKNGTGLCRRRRAEAALIQSTLKP